MSLLKRLFSRDYRAACGAEAAGDLMTAARGFATSGADLELLRVTRRRAEGCLDPRERVDLRRLANDVAGRLEDETVRRDTAGALAEALEALAAVVEPAEGKALRTEAGALFVSSGAPERAGPIFEAAGDFELATQAYIAAGDLAAVERTAARGPDDEDLQRAGLQGWVQALLSCGRADEAVAAIEEAARDADADRRAQAKRLRERLPGPHRLALRDTAGAIVRLCSEPSVEIGREDGLAMSVQVASVSRRHVGLQRSGGELIVSNLSRSGGLTIDGEPVLAPVLLDAGRPTATLVVGDGDRCVLTVQLAEAGHWQVRAAIDGILGESLLLSESTTIGDIDLVATGRWWTAGQHVLITGDRVGDDYEVTG